MLKYNINNKTIKASWWNSKIHVGDKLSFDIETPLFEKGKYPDIVLASAYANGSVYFIRPEDLASFIEIHKKSTFIAHNIAYDICITAHHIGKKDWMFEMVEDGRALDSHILARLINLAKEGDAENIKHKYSLGGLVKEVLNLDLPKEVEVEGETVRFSYAKYLGKLDEMPAAYYNYNAYDTVSTFMLWEALERTAQPLSTDGKLLSHKTQVKALVSAFLTSMIGIGIDKEKVSGFGELFKEEITKTDGILESKYGYSSGTGKEKALERALSTVEKNEGVVFERYLHKSGKKELYTSSAKALEPYSHIEFVALYLKRQKQNKFLKTFIRPLVDKEIVHPKINILKNTGRLSMSSPNLQQIPRPTKEIDLRSIFIARPGFKFVIVDFVAAELVTLAQTLMDLFGYSKLADALNAKKDVHALTASAFLNKDPSEITKDERQYGKIANFGLPAGLGVNSTIAYANNSYKVELTEEEAKDIKTAWLKTYPELQEYLDYPNSKLIDKIVVDTEEVNARFAIHTFFGVMGGRTHTKTSNNEYTLEDIEWAWNNARLLINRMPKLQKFREEILDQRGSPELENIFKRSLTAVVKRTGRIRNNCGFCDFNNNAFQGLLADISIHGFFDLHKEGIRVVHAVHDEIVAEVPAEEAESYQKRIEKILIKAAKTLCPDVEMRVDSGIRNKWEKI
jgi:DNA polymerase I-like protein with 3'-5' exonuclease and polymerase domains